ncbi:MBL fold metallo-hydrolase [Candidatus Woesearchaeota archaeon]|nr:MBL fold metallo-hydrolase [Candidatus Woesearchaeota archaeon]
MKFTKYAQSCVLIETRDLHILVDPGNLNFEASLLDKWSNIHLILVTHKHQDHCLQDAVKYLLGKGAVLFSSKEVALAYPELKVHLLKEGDALSYKGVKIEAVKAVHGYIPALKGKEIGENLGYIISDGNKKAYFTGDTIGFPNECRCDIIFLPVCNHGLVFGPSEAVLFAKETGAGLAVPVHYDNPKYPTDLKLVKEEFEQQGLKCKVMKIKESIEL